MAFIGVQVSEELKARFTARAQREGGQSALLRRLVCTVTDQAPDPVRPLAVGASDKVTVRFRRSERAAITDAATARGMTRTGWIAALVRARLGLGLPLNRGEEEALRAIARELHRIGGSINQIARAANLAAQTGEPVMFDPAVLEETRGVVGEATSELRQVLARSAGSWQVPV
ncbi:plasmid mobilization relaxosome protein MobC (plasmid) [Methylobacterium sp. DM1]|nr:plasmid mobilization relaxosome protein MobC [Methylobacterium sp. DM1]